MWQLLEQKHPARKLLELAERVVVMAEKSPVVVEDQHAHGIEPDRVFAGVEVLGEVGCRQSIESFLGKTLAAVLTELVADEDQVVFFVGDEVDGIAAVRPPLSLRISKPLRSR